MASFFAGRVKAANKVLGKAALLFVLGVATGHVGCSSAVSSRFASGEWKEYATRLTTSETATLERQSAEELMKFVSQQEISMTLSAVTQETRTRVDLGRIDHHLHEPLELTLSVPDWLGGRQRVVWRPRDNDTIYTVLD